MYKIDLYEDKNGRCDVSDFICSLKDKSKSDKNARINYHKVIAYIDILEEKGTWIGEPFIKHLDGEIWELRPLSNRILFAAFKADGFVLLHHFVKKTKKTPKREIEKAIREFEDYKERNE